MWNSRRAVFCPFAFFPFRLFAQEKNMGQIIELPPNLEKCGDPGGEELHPLPLNLLARGREVPCAVYLKAKGESGTGSSYRLAWSRGQVFHPGPAYRMEAAWGYFALSEAARVLAYLKERLKEVSRSGEASPREQAAFLRDAILVWTAQFYTAPGARTPGQVAAVLQFLAALQPFLSQDRRSRRLGSELRRYDSGLFTHVLNVCLLGMSVTRSLGWPEQEAVAFGLGALLHDVGLSSNARATWSKSGPLSEEELAAIKDHPQAGVKLLQALPGLPAEVAIMCAQHHENADGTGYPLGLALDALHPWARLLKILDTFESLTSIRPWRAPLSGPKALRLMSFSGQGKSEYDAGLLNLFAEFWEEA